MHSRWLYTGLRRAGFFLWEKVERRGFRRQTRPAIIPSASARAYVICSYSSKATVSLQRLPRMLDMHTMSCDGDVRRNMSEPGVKGRRKAVLLHGSRDLDMV